MSDLLDDLAGAAPPAPAKKKRAPRKKPALPVPTTSDIMNAGFEALPQKDKDAVLEDMVAKKRARERQEELDAAEHDSKLSGFQRTKWLRYLTVTAVVVLISAFLAVVVTFLVLAVKSGVLNDGGLITGVFGVLKEAIQVLVGL